ncbi:unnamed protein product [Blepharisma stoltei]|uniref:Rab5-interacting protein n=1 Tax=Blepharisma stoltei TaxID=1481888 RepID=A0AAU9JE79_9CILI|nr:unnamed protein product [Blepharisma stoltei]
MALSSIGKAFSPNPRIEKDELMDYLHWVKQALGLIFGIIVGSAKYTGFPVIVIFAIALSAVSLFYAWKIIGTEEIEAWDIVSEAFGPGFFSFILAWILGYTFL